MGYASTKVCSKCGIEKPSDAFGKHRGTCKPCRSAAGALWNKENSARYKAKLSKWREENSDYLLAYRKKRREEHPELHSMFYDRWRRNNLAHRAFQQSSRHAAQLQATPSWLSAIELAQIEEFYEVAACVTMQTGEKHNVDHIIPLRGEAVRGLHVPWNLQVISASENFSKKNRVREAA